MGLFPPVEASGGDDACIAFDLWSDKKPWEISPSEATPAGKADKGKRRNLTAMFHGSGGGENKEPAAAVEGSADEKGKKKSSWGFNGLKKWKKSGAGGNEDAPAGGDSAPPRSG